MSNYSNNLADKTLKFKEYRKLRDSFDLKDESGFKSIHELGIDYKTTELGIFLPAQTVTMFSLFQDLIANGFLDPELPFLDAGSGDARVNQLAALSGVKNSIGIEYSPEILEKSREQTKAFEDAKIIEKDYVKLIQGDFTKIETFSKNGLDIKSIKTFFNYINGWKELLAFINDNSPVGTKLIIIDEQFNISSRIMDEVCKHKSMKLVDVLKYIHYKNKDFAELITPEMLSTILESDSTIQNQHIKVNISPSDEFSITDTDYSVVTVYLFEKIS